jgi:ClpP class serine protease
MQELGQFMSLVSDEKQKVQKIQEEKDKRFKPRVSVGQSLSKKDNLQVLTNTLICTQTKIQKEQYMV